VIAVALDDEQAGPGTGRSTLRDFTMSVESRRSRLTHYEQGGKAADAAEESSRTALIVM